MNSKRLLEIAKLEVRRQTSNFNKQTVAVVLIASLVGGLILTVSGIPAIDSELYTVAVQNDSDVRPALEQADSIRVVSDSYQVDAIVRGTTVEAPKTQKGQAAYREISSAVETYNRQQLREEANTTAAFPVTVSISYISQRGGVLQEAAGTGSESQQGLTEEDKRQVDRVQNSSFEGGAPDSIEPPFPFESLILAFFFLIPMNFFVQNYASSIIDERLNRRGELLLASPATRGDIIVGKTLPYFVFLSLVSAILTLVVGGGILSFLAVLPVALAYLATGFLAGIFSRSYKELTFVVLGASIFFTLFTFIPAIFTSVLPIASISPLSVVVFELEGTAIPIESFLFSIGPLLVSAPLLFIFGAGIFREEYLFTQKRVPEKFIEALGIQSSSWRRLFIIGIAIIPFVFAAELLAISVFFVVPSSILVLVFILVLAFIEELAKSLPVYAGVVSDHLKNTPRSVFLSGSVAGLGFFIGEKIFVVSQAVGLLNVDLGEIAFITSVFPDVNAGEPLSIVILLLFPLIHPITTAISSFGARYGTGYYAVTVVAGTIIHALYNIGTVMMYAG